MKAKKSVPYVLIVVAPFLLAMGIMGEPPARKTVPEPKERLDARMVDSEGIQTEITHVSYDGELYLPVRRGQALVTIPFDTIARLEFGARKNTTRKVTIRFRDGSQEAFRIDDKVLFVGKVPYGTYQIQAKDLEEVTLIRPGTEESDPEGSPGGKESSP